MPYSYPYPRPAVTVDCLVFRRNNNRRQILLIQRKNEPYKGRWALPGGFIEMDETLLEAAVRELREETGLNVPVLEQFRTFDAIDRDPRHRTISTVFIGSVGNESGSLKASSDASRAKWHSIDNLPDLAFDHKDIIRQAIEASRPEHSGRGIFDP
jgi:8-oxo-dGTP diphosphatase